MDESLVAVLSEESFLPKDALRKAVAHPERIVEPVLRVVALAADDPDEPSDEEVNLLFWGVHALAAARDTRVFAPLLRLLRHDDETLEGIFGDAITETLPLVLAGTYDGDAEAFHRFILDTTLDEAVRHGALIALGFLTRTGRLDREASRMLLVRFDDARIAAEGELGWVGWEEVIAYLGFTDLVPRVEVARRDGRVSDEFSDFSWFRDALRQTTASPPRYDAFDTARYGYLDDPVAALHWTAENYGQPVKNPFKDVGRNDPCPCGSGKKYKKCCLSAAPEAGPITSPLPGLH